MSIETYELELEETRHILNRSRVNLASLKRQILEDQLKFLKTIFDGEKDKDKMFALLAAIRGIEEYLAE